ncbi:hypothetical protein LTS18_004350 [Coniosporium uncinatum]|uniref:Uncharacterized protein n=1 Tax=Coniosporium uncinatum TaxID=93489 RepID=A0ACC3DY15_9PEZI|nr:hypothetical protein LTS18_004350 [Coniosporium uncinatum]
MIMPQVLSLLILAISASAQIDYAQYVNPFIGSEGPISGQAFGGGDIFVGGAVPFGVVKLGMDSHEANLSVATLNGGYTPQGNVTAFSMLHESGTGGCPKYGVIPQMPLTTVDSPVNILDNTTYWQSRVGNDTATVGYFRTELANGVTTELSASRHAGILQHSFPAGEKHVLVDISHYLPQGNGGYCDQYFIGGEIDLQPGGSVYSGYGTYVGGWNEGEDVKPY